MYGSEKETGVRVTMKSMRRGGVSGRMGTLVGLALASLVAEVQPAERLMVPGIEVPRTVEARLTVLTDQLGETLATLRQGLSPELLVYLADVEIFYKAVNMALREDEFIRESEFEVAERLLEQGFERARRLEQGRLPWLQETGWVVRGYYSHIDDSVQPYGVVIPESARAKTRKPFRADVWLHGRDNRLTELKFLDVRQQSNDRFVPPDTFVLHPYGRFCNAFKFAGEVDVFEGLEALKRDYPIDPQRITIRGFSMGGAGCWHLAVHHPDIWVAAAPGAGFAESAEYLGLWRKDPKPTWYQMALWNLYDATAYALNLFHVPTVAYSGEIDRQIQAARMMETALADEGMRLRHVIGPATGHTYHPSAKVEVSSRIDAIASRAKESLPRQVRFTTWTLRYPGAYWFEILGLNQHWQRARVDARIEGASAIGLELENVYACRMAFNQGEVPFEVGTRVRVRVGRQTIPGPMVEADSPWSMSLVRDASGWRRMTSASELVGRKRPGLQGPIDDAFMDRFLIVEPTGRFPQTPAGGWMQRELTRLKREWRGQFRGNARTVRADRLTSTQIASSHLVLFGNPECNPVLGRIAPRLPVRWHQGELALGEDRWNSEWVVPLLIYPNPLNPERYVVINSGFTFRGFGSNATQVPMLPDYALVDTRTRETTLVPGKVVETGFFDENWDLKN